MGLQDAVRQAFGADGVLAQYVEEFSPRSGQTAMAEAVGGTMESGGVLVVEAGTGVGKTFAYLVPALLSGERVLLSTATKTLQDQLFVRDIPRLVKALGLPVRTALLKGRSSYLCMHRLGNARQDDLAHKATAQRDLARVESWSLVTHAGDMAELTQIDERSPVLPLVTSTRENCLGARCPQINSCHVNLARREAMAADVVVINHHLFFADLNIRESGVAELLPTVRSVVFDEAHQLNEIGVQFLGRQLTTNQLDNFLRDLTAHGRLVALAHAAWPGMLEEFERSAGAMRAVCGVGRTAGRIAWDVEQPSGLDLQAWQHAVSELHAALQQTDVVLRSIEELSPELKLLQERGSRLVSELDMFSHALEPEAVRWLEVGVSQVRLVQSPLDIADAMRTRVIAPDGVAESGKSWIFTSATLGHDATMSQFVESCGLEGAQVLKVESPFDYPAQSTLYIPTQMPKPGDLGHSAAVAQLVAQGAAVLGGRTLVLTTTLRAMREIAEALRKHFDAFSFIDVLLQGESSKRELTQRLVQGSVAGNNGCILVGSASFWEGIDVPGDALQLVVIDKLPFSPPGDPVVEARARQLDAAGRNPFNHYHVPQAAIALKQGAGRLIRRETDRGMLVVCDVRLAQMGYGRRIIEALPPMRRITLQEQFGEVLAGLVTRPSTKDH